MGDTSMRQMDRLYGNQDLFLRLRCKNKKVANCKSIDTLGKASGSFVAASAATLSILPIKCDCLLSRIKQSPSLGGRRRKHFDRLNSLNLVS